MTSEDTNKKEEIDKVNIYSLDYPITSRKEDLLGRSEFAESLAKAIISWGSESSLVISLFGPWGYGKTSVLNMVIDSLEDKTEVPCYIIKFNPWQYSDSNILIQSLHDEIVEKLGSNDSNENKKVIDDFSKFISFMGSASALATLYGYVEPATGAVLTLTSKYVGKIIQVISSKPKEQEKVKKSYSSLKNNLRSSLSQLNKPIFIIIDDIDRLDPEEIKFIFRLIKANLDLPNIIFLLAFQKDIVEKALTRKTADGKEHFSGEDYLKKIVQLGFDMPKIQPSQIENVLFKNLDRIIGESNFEEGLFDEERWRRLYDSGMKHYFNNLRDVYRFSNMLEFNFRLLTTDEKLNVNIVDLLGIETIRVFENDTYRKIIKSREALTNYPDSFFINKKEVEQEIKQIYSESRNSMATINILGELFPTATWALEGIGSYSDSGEDWLKKLRIVHSDNFDRYFIMNIPEHDISQAEFLSILSIVDDKTKFLAILLDLSKKRLLSLFLERLHAYLSEIPSEIYLSLLDSLYLILEKMELSDSAPKTKFSIDFSFKILTIVYGVFDQVKDNDQKESLLKESIVSSESLYLPLLVINRECLRHNEPNANGQPISSKEVLNELIKAGLDKIKLASKENATTKLPYIDYILSRWSEWGDLNEIREYVSKVVERKDGALDLIVGFLRSMNIYSGNITKTHYYLDLDEIGKYIDISTLKGLIDSVPVDELAGDCKLAYDTFQKGFVFKTEAPEKYSRWKRGDYS